MQAKQAAHSQAKAAQEKLEAQQREKQIKKDNKAQIAAESQTKQQAIATNLANEKQKKQELGEAERKAHNAEEKMQEANSKAADAAVQSRHCEGEMYRRRRTCACDDIGGAGGRRLLYVPNVVSAAASSVATTLGISTPTSPPTPPPTTPAPTPPPTMAPTLPVTTGGSQVSQADQEIAQKKMDNWERRRYVRRRYVKPSAADRRRRYAFPAPPPPARLPGAVCPCCTPAPDGTPDPKPACQKAAKAATKHKTMFGGG
jgi:hypothetical protein